MKLKTLTIPALFLSATLSFTSALSAECGACEAGHEKDAPHCSGAHASHFTLKDLSGKKHSLSQYAGKVVVLEWTNFECPFVAKHYHHSGNIPKLQKKYTDKDIVWLSIASGKTAAKTNSENAQEAGSAASAVLLDPTGKTGQKYGAKTTPHFFILDQAGHIVYEGAIDSTNSTKAEDIEKSENYISKALDELLAKKKISSAKTPPYGCSVKYLN